MENNQFFTTLKETEQWLKAMEVENYTINDDLTVDVDGRVKIDDKNLTHIPVQFGQVKGSFICNNNNLKNLKGCPNYVERNFHCHDNQLTSLQDCPKTIKSSFWFFGNPINDISDIVNIEVKNNIYFTPHAGMSYLDKYKGSDGDIEINFDLFKKLQIFKKLNEKLSDELPMNTKNSKKMKI